VLLVILLRLRLRVLLLGRRGSWNALTVVAAASKARERRRRRSRGGRGDGEEGRRVVIAALCVVGWVRWIEMRAQCGWVDEK
jgi:hypothetical protein